ncbi:MAG: GNAT family N-acetyltransferase [SAR202 cluster bacterium]|nr:GNAT family N-acetyltransferase [SAR202 cluster bacterium]|tara:strand:+ start:72 stop:644 length:573 start_codon:yes stop_codon:yes gene_type:complete
MFHPSQVLSGPNFKLIPFTEEHLSERYLGWLNDPEVNRFLEIRFTPQTRDTVTEYIQAIYQSKEAYMWGIYPKGNDQPVGTATLLGINRNHDSAGIGLMIGDKEYWGSNCALEVLGLVAEFAFETLGLRRLAEESSGPNHSINFTLRRFGFTFEGKMRQASVIGPGEYCDGYRWGLLVDEWRAKYRPTGK